MHLCYKNVSYISKKYIQILEYVYFIMKNRKLNLTCIYYK